MNVKTFLIEIKFFTQNVQPFATFINKPIFLTKQYFLNQGGMKAVVWVDTLQSFVMLAGMLAVLIKTVMLVGGADKLYSLLDEGKRTNFLT